MSVIEANGLSFAYEDSPILQELSFSIQKGEFIAVLGANGSGKTTLARLFNALLEPPAHRLQVMGLDPAEEESIRELRRLCGMVFQNPDNQFVSSVIEEDLAFGPRNFDCPEQEIPNRVAEALSLVGMEGFERRDPYMLSGGQKQRIALAGVLASRPKLIICDEATSMLDPAGRQQMLRHLHALHCKGRTVILITHYAEEATEADRILLLKEGRLLAFDSPRAILTDRVLLARAGLLPPFAVTLYYDLLERGVSLPHCPLTREELLEELCCLN